MILIHVTYGCRVVYLKYVVFSGPIENLDKLKTSIAQHIHSVKPYRLRSMVKHALSRFQLVTENGVQHVEHLLHKACDQ